MEIVTHSSIIKNNSLFESLIKKALDKGIITEETLEELKEELIEEDEKKYYYELNDPLTASVDEDKEIELFDKFFPKKNDWSIVPEIVGNECSNSHLHILALSGELEVLDHPMIFTLKNDDENTPFHYLAVAGKMEVLKYPEVFTLKNIRGDTPFHFLALMGKIEVLDYPEVINLKNKDKETPLHYLADENENIIEILKCIECATLQNIHGITPLSSMLARFYKYCNVYYPQSPHQSQSY